MLPTDASPSRQSLPLCALSLIVTAMLTFFVCAARAQPVVPSPTPTSGNKDDLPVGSLDSLKKAAEIGDAASQYKLGVALATGNEVPKNLPEAIKWYKRAAEQGFAKAQNSLGNYYLVGDEGIPKDAAEGLKWHRRAAEQGNPIMQWQLASEYSSGSFGIPKDVKEAARWMRYAAEQGFSMAQSALGVMYNGGDGVPQDFVLAYFWMNLGATGKNRWTLDGERPADAEPALDAQSAASAEKFRKFHADLRDSVAALMTPAQLAEAQRLTREFRPKKWDVLSKQSISKGDLDADVCGSGFFITQDGYFVTNHHVVADARRVRVKTANGVYSAKVVSQDQANDLALLKVDGTFQALRISGSAAVHTAERVFTIGYPNPTLQGVLPKYSSGEIAALTGPGDDPRFLQISVPVQPGNSGGPLLDAKGGVVGVVVGQLDKAVALKASGQLPENVNYAIKGSLLLTMLESVSGLDEKLKSVPLPSATDSSLVKTVEAATGMALVDR